MIHTVYKKKILDKVHQKPPHHRSSFTGIPIQDGVPNLASIAERCIPNPGDRGRVIVFIDGSNLFYAASDLEVEIDYIKLLDYLVDNARLVHVLFYTGNDPENEKQCKFLKWMSRNGFRVIAKALTQAPNDVKKANLDVEIAVDMMTLAGYCDTAVLVSGDGDFAYVVDAIAKQGVRVEVVSLRSMTSSTLIDVADCYVDLADIQQTVKKIDGDVGSSVVTTEE
ncbi:MAG: NYN domain-containing protein [Cyanobacteria bacterium CAN_BIN43]|nr:NYN domain-containing protein [Cyanobacteria bacterium CAN_BIN43]